MKLDKFNQPNLRTFYCRIQTSADTLSVTGSVIIRHQRRKKTHTTPNNESAATSGNDVNGMTGTGSRLMAGLPGAPLSSSASGSHQ